MEKYGRYKQYCVFNLLFLFLINQICLSQNYDYTKYLFELKLAGKMYALEKSSSFDSIDHYLRKYENRLGYKYYYYRALVENNKNSGKQMNYLDSAFRRGLGIKCMGKSARLFDSMTVAQSFQLNFLKAYDDKYIAELQRMNYLDQKHRAIIAGCTSKLMKESNQKEGGLGWDTLLFSKEQKGLKKDLDSLWRLQNKLDSLNFSRLNELIAEKGWPSAKLIGLGECIEYKVPNPAIIVMHLGTAERTYQAENLKSVILLCLKNEESWGSAESLIFNIYHRFRLEYSEFSFLEIKNNNLNETKSFFALYQMAELLIKKPKEIIELKCKDIALFNEVKRSMLKVNTQISLAGFERIYREMGRPQPEHLIDSRFRFVQDKGMKNGKLLFRFVMP